MPKSATISGIKSVYNYTIQEAADVSGVSDRTVRGWVKLGLHAMSSERPILIRGDALIAFIKAQRKARKTDVDPTEFYCLKCRTARKPASGLVDCELKGNRAKLTAICDTCETMMHKPIALGQVSQLGEVFDLTVHNTAAATGNSAAE